MVTVHLPGVLATYAGGNKHVQVPLPANPTPVTVAAVLHTLGTRHPGVRQRVLDDQDRLRPHVNIFLNDENIRTAEGLATPVSPTDELWIIPAVSGGG